MALDFLVAHGEETEHDADPVQVVGDNRAVGGAVLPTEDGVENTPASTAVELRVCELDLC